MISKKQTSLKTKKTKLKTNTNSLKFSFVENNKVARIGKGGHRGSVKGSKPSFSMDSPTALSNSSKAVAGSPVGSFDVAPKAAATKGGSKTPSSVKQSSFDAKRGETTFTPLSSKPATNKPHMQKEIKTVDYEHFASQKIPPHLRKAGVPTRVAYHTGNVLGASYKTLKTGAKIGIATAIKTTVGDGGSADSGGREIVSTTQTALAYGQELKKGVREVKGFSEKAFAKGSELTPFTRFSFNKTRREAFKTKYRLDKKAYYKMRAKNLKAVQVVGKGARAVKRTAIVQKATNNSIYRGTRTIIKGVSKLAGMIIQAILTIIGTLFGTLLPLIAVALFVIVLFSTLAPKEQAISLGIEIAESEAEITLTVYSGRNRAFEKLVVSLDENNEFHHQEKTSGGNVNELTGVRLGDSYRVTGTWNNIIIKASGNYSDSSMLLSGSLSKKKGNYYGIQGDGELSYPVPTGKYLIWWGFGGRDTGIPGATTNHQGIDIGYPGWNSMPDVPILAVADGTVVTWWNSAAGNSITIDHGNGISSEYMHIKNGGYLVSNGEKVIRGQQIALTGETGVARGAHLHFGVMVNGVNVDPAPYLGLSSGHSIDFTVGE